MFAKVLAISSTVALLVWVGFFFMGSLPLLVLKHDTPLDAGFIRGLFNVYYRAVMATAVVGTVGYALSDRAAIALVMASLAGLAVLSRRWIVGLMDEAGNAILALGDSAAIRRFRRLHIGGMLLNAAQLAIFCVGMTKVEFTGLAALARAQFLGAQGPGICALWRESRPA